MTSLPHEMKLDIDKGETIDLNILLYCIQCIAAIFQSSPKTRSQDTLQSALMAKAATGLQNVMSRDRGDCEEGRKHPRCKNGRQKQSQNHEENMIRHLTNKVDRIFKSINELKSDVGIIKQHVFQKQTQQQVGRSNFRRRNPFQGRGDQGTCGRY